MGAELANKSIGAQSGVHFKHGWAVDNHHETVATYQSNICGATNRTVICEDVRRVKPTKLKEIAKIDGFAYGFPCNDFSLVGEHLGIDGRFGPLYSFGLPIIESHSPYFFIAENVSGIKSANDGMALKKILDDLSHAGKGYVVTPHLYKFEEYGLPQARHRLIMVGFRRDLGLTFLPPAPTHLSRMKNCKDAIEKPPIKEGTPNHERARQHPRVVERLRHIQPGENAWTANLPASLKLNVKGAQISQIYKRLDPTKPAYTITGSGGGGTHVYHWSEHRSLTNRERARLQTFPDHFKFIGGKESVRRQIGMAVPPEGAKIIFEAIARTLAGITYKSVKL